MAGGAAGTDIFPYEYRNYSAVKDVRFVLPNGYNYVSAAMVQTRGLYAAATTTESQSNLTATLISAGNYSINLENYLTENGGNIRRGDESYDGTVTITISPDCNRTENTSSRL